MTLKDRQQEAGPRTAWQWRTVFGRRGEQGAWPGRVSSFCGARKERIRENWGSGGGFGRGRGAWPGQVAGSPAYGPAMGREQRAGDEGGERSRGWQFHK